MTFFLNQPESLPQIPANNPAFDLPQNWFDGLSAGITTAQLENDANFVAARRTQDERYDTRREAIRRLDRTQIEELARQNGVSDSQIAYFLDNPDSRMARIMPPGLESAIFDLAGKAGWADLDVSDDAIAERANERMRAEYEDAQGTLEMMPRGQGLAGFLGGMIGITVDAKNLPFMLMGGGSGSILRVMGREAAINMAAEAAFLPSEFSQAERLQIPDPSVVTQLSMAAVAGGALGGLMEAGARGLTYFRLRNSARVPGYGDGTAQSVTDAVEDILTGDTPRPFEQIERLRREASPYLLENPINPVREPLVPREPDWDAAMARAQAGQVAEPGDLTKPTVTTEPLPRVDGGPREPLTDQNFIETMQAAIDDAKAVDSRFKRPLIETIIRGARSGGEDFRINPDGFVGGELKARGYNSRTAPGIWSRKGRNDLDNLPADEWEREFPGIMDATGTKPGDTYLDRDGFVSLLERDLGGDSTWLRTRADVQRLEAQMEEYLRVGEVAPEVRYKAGEKAPGGLFIDRNAYEEQFAGFAPGQIRKEFDAWLDESGYTMLTDAEKAEIVAELQANGGEAEYLVERTLEREADAVERPNGWTDEIPWDAPNDPARGADGQGSVRGEPDAGTPEGSGAGQDGRAAGLATEGGQSVIPGAEADVARSTAARQADLRREADARAQQSRMGTTKQQDGAGPLFGDEGGFQLGIFDDVSTPEAKALLEQKTQDVRDAIAGADFEVEIETPDGAVVKMKASEVLDDLDEGDIAADFFDGCGKGSAE